MTIRFHSTRNRRLRTAANGKRTRRAAGRFARSGWQIAAASLVSFRCGSSSYDGRIRNARRGAAHASDERDQEHPGERPGESRSEPVGRARRHHERRCAGSRRGRHRHGRLLGSVRQDGQAARRDARRGAGPLRQRSLRQAAQRGGADPQKPDHAARGSDGNPTSPTSTRASSRTPPSSSPNSCPRAAARASSSRPSPRRSAWCRDTSCNARPSTSWPSCCSLVGARSPRCGRVSAARTPARRTPRLLL